MVKEISPGSPVGWVAPRAQGLLSQAVLQSEITSLDIPEQLLEPYKHQFRCYPFEELESNFQKCVQNFLPEIYIAQDKAQTGQKGFEFSIGRHSSNPISLNDAVFSRRHLMCAYIAGANPGEYRLEVSNHSNVKHANLLYLADASNTTSEGQLLVIKPREEQLLKGPHLLNDAESVLLIGRDNVYKLIHSNLNSEQLPTIRIERAKILQIEPKQS